MECCLVGVHWALYSLQSVEERDNGRACYRIWIDSSKAAVLLVDIGGGRGHEMEKFQQKFPQDKSRVVLQDLPQVVEEVKWS